MSAARYREVPMVTVLVLLLFSLLMLQSEDVWRTRGKRPGGVR